MKESVFLAMAFGLIYFVYQYYPDAVIGFGLGCVAAEWFYVDKGVIPKRRQ
jgi:hypothetical protein